MKFHEELERDLLDVFPKVFLEGCSKKLLKEPLEETREEIFKRTLDKFSEENSERILLEKFSVEVLEELSKKLLTT